MYLGQHNPVDTNSSFKQAPAWTTTPIKGPPIQPTTSYRSKLCLSFREEQFLRHLSNTDMLLKSCLHHSSNPCSGDLCPNNLHLIRRKLIHSSNKSKSDTLPLQPLIVPNNIKSCQVQLVHVEMWSVSNLHVMYANTILLIRTVPSNKHLLELPHQSKDLRFNPPLLIDLNCVFHFGRTSFWDTCPTLTCFWNPAFTTAPIPVLGIVVPITFTWSEENSFTHPHIEKRYLAFATSNSTKQH